MLEFNQIGDTNILEFTLDGAFTKADYDKLIVKADEMIEEFGTVKMIEIFRHIGKMEPAAIWADFKWTPRHIKHFSHVAVVADQKWIEWMVGPIKAFVSAEIRCFHLDEIEDARRWISEEIAV